MTKQEIRTKLDSFQQLFVKSDSDLLTIEKAPAKIIIADGEPGTKERIAQYRAMVERNEDLPLDE